MRTRLSLYPLRLENLRFSNFSKSLPSLLGWENIRWYFVHHAKQAQASVARFVLITRQNQSIKAQIHISSTWVCLHNPASSKKMSKYKFKASQGRDAVWMQTAL